MPLNHGHFKRFGIVVLLALGYLNAAHSQKRELSGALPPVLDQGFDGATQYAS